MAFLNPVRFVVLVGVVTLLYVQPASGQAAGTTEYELKAAVLHRFLGFVDWPSEVLAPESQDPIVIGILGDDPFGDILDNTLEGQTVGNRTLTVRRGRDLRRLGFCHVVFISSSEGDNLPAILHALREAVVLTIGDMDGFAVAGGMIGLRLEDNRIRFAVNIDAVGESELTVSSRLLRLATIVRKEPAGGGQ